MTREQEEALAEQFADPAPHPLVERAAIEVLLGGPARPVVVLGWREMLALAALAVALLGVGTCVGALGALAWSERRVAACHELRAEAFEATWESKRALDACTCAVTGRCGR